MVLARNTSIDIKQIYSIKKEKINFDKYNIDQTKDILINPNFRFYKYIKKVDLVILFEEIIEKYIVYSNGKAYIFAHDYVQDRYLVKSIYEKFENNNNVILIEEKFNCIEIEEFMSKFNIGLMSRWHALVHSIRVNLPVLIFGWSEKYIETASLFNITENIIDIREDIDVNKIIESLIRVRNNRSELLIKINKKHEEIKKTYILERKGELWLK